MRNIRWIYAVLLAAALSAFVAACGGEDAEKPAQSRTTTSQSPSATAKNSVPTGDLRVAVPSLALGQGVWESGIQLGWQFLAPASDLLVYTSRDMSKLIPGLAEKWDVAPDNMSVTFHLRKGVQFHDGNGELTSKDVEYSIAAAMAESSQYTAFKTLIGPLIARVEADTPYDITIRTKTARADVMPWLFSPASQAVLPIISSTYVKTVGMEQAARKMVYSGPYKVVEYKERERLVLEAQPQHWRVVPEYKTLTFLEVPEQATRAAMLRKGDVDIMETTAEGAKTLAGDQFEVVRVEGGVNVSLTLGGLWVPETATYDPKLPWTDQRVREAMNIAINRDELSKTIFAGFGSPSSTYRPLPWSKEFTAYPYDAKKAKQLIADAGFKNGFKVDLWVLLFPGQVPEIQQTVQAVAGYWKSIGLDVNVTVVEMAAVVNKILARQTTGVSFPISSTAAYPWEDGMLSFFSENKRFPLGGESREMDAVFKKLLASSDTNERTKLTRDVTKIIYDEYRTIPLVAVDRLYLKNTTRVGKWQPLQLQRERLNWEWITHTPALGTFRLFEP